MTIPEIEAYRFYRWTTDSRQVSFAEFKANLIKAGYVIEPDPKAEKSNELERKKD